MDEKVKRGSTGLAVKVGLWYVLSNFLVKAISFITTPLFARLMTPEQYGEFSNYASWQSTLLILTGAEMYSTLSRAYYDYTEDYDQYVSSVTVTGFFITGGMYILFLLNQSWIYSVVAIPPQFVHMLFFTLAFQSCKAIWLARERTLYRYKTVAVVSMLNLVVPTLVALALVLWLPEEQRLSGRLYGTYIPMSAIGIGCAVQMLHKGRAFRLDHAKYAFKLSLPLLVHFMTVSLLTSSNTVITKSIMGAEAAALVSITTSTIHILTILFQTLSGAVTTWLMDNLNQKNVGTVRKGIGIYSAGVVIVAIGTILLAPEIVWILGGKQYMAAVDLIPGMVLGIVFQSVASIFNIILTYDKNVVKTAVYTGIVAVISILAKILLLPVFGYNSLAWINALAFGALFVINYFLVKKSGYGGYLDLKVISAVICGCGVFVAISGGLYQHALLRYGVIALAVVASFAVLYRFRHPIMKLLKSKLKKKNNG